MSPNDPNQIPPDPIYAKSLSWPIAIASLALFSALMLAMADEFLFRRPYKAYQQEFMGKYVDYLDRLQEQRKSVEETIKGLDEYEALDQAVKDEEAAIRDEQSDLDRKTKNISAQIRSLSDALKPHNSMLAALTYKGEHDVHYDVHNNEGDPRALISQHPKASEEREKMADVLAKQAEYSWMEREADGSTVEKSDSGAVGDLRVKVLDLRAEKGVMQAEMAKLTKDASAARKALNDWLKTNLRNIALWLENTGDDAAKEAVASKVAEVGVNAFLANHTTGLTSQQIEALKQSTIDDGPIVDTLLAYGQIKEIYIKKAAHWVDRCETCHMGTRSPVPITEEDVPGEEGHERLFVSHPNRELLEIHPPEEFGCSLCHNGNGVAITQGKMMEPEYLPHGLNKYWLHKLHPRENFEAGCVRCHDNDVQLDHGERINAGRQTFFKLGCWGCHERAGYDMEGVEARLAQKRMGEIDAELAELALQQQNMVASVDPVYEKDESRAEELMDGVRSRVAAITQKMAGLNSERAAMAREFASLSSQRKKVGPNLREVRKKLNKGWLTPWIANPTHWRPSTKMPAYRWDETFEDEAQKEEVIRAIAAFIWQQADDPAKAPVKKGGQGDAKVGRELFWSVGCMSCHAVGEGEDKVGSDFAANLSYLGDKANLDYITSWIRDPRSHNPKTVMPSFRLTEKESRDIATYLLSESNREGFSADDGSWLEDESLRAKGEEWTKHFGCAGCHDINGLENEGRIGVPLTKAGSKPHEQLDFGHFTAQAKRGTFDPLLDWETADGVKLFELDKERNGKKWYGHRGFFMHKLAAPGVYDIGKLKANPAERLRMPKFSLTAQQMHDLTAFLLGSVDPDQTPDDVKYQPDAQGKAVQEGWRVVKRYNCQGCHQVLPGGVPTIQTLEHFLPGAENHPDLPPSLHGTGFRTNPDWLGRFLHDPSLGGGEQNPKSGRPYLDTRMPSFEMTDKEVDTLVRFFDAMSDQPEVYRKPEFVPLSTAEMRVAQAIFDEAKCASCHVVEGQQMTTETKAPNLTLAETRLRPAWIKQWIATPDLLVPGTAMPRFFQLAEDGTTWRSNSNQDLIKSHPGDHIDLMVRYLRSLSRSK